MAFAIESFTCPWHVPHKPRPYPNSYAQKATPAIMSAKLECIYPENLSRVCILHAHPVGPRPWVSPAFIIEFEQLEARTEPQKVRCLCQPQANWSRCLAMCATCPTQQEKTHFQDVCGYFYFKIQKLMKYIHFKWIKVCNIPIINLKIFIVNFLQCSTAPPARKLAVLCGNCICHTWLALRCSRLRLATVVAGGKRAMGAPTHAHIDNNTGHRTRVAKQLQKRRAFCAKRKG